jgi:hypothetical protein
MRWMKKKASTAAMMRNAPSDNNRFIRATKRE